MYGEAVEFTGLELLGNIREYFYHRKLLLWPTISPHSLLCTRDMVVPIPTEDIVGNIGLY